MIRHAFRLIWNRKRRNALILLEIFFACLVVFAVGTLGIYTLDNYRRPLGYEFKNVWSVEVDLRGQIEKQEDTDRRAVFERLLREIGSLDPVEAVAGARGVPFEESIYEETFGWEGRMVNAETNRVSLDFAEVLDVETVRGRWFEPGDAAFSWTPVVIDEELARQLFGSEDPVGKVARPGDPKTGAGERRVVGVVSDFRRSGELSGPGPYLIELWKPGVEEPSLDKILIRLRPGTPAAFEQELVERLRGVAREASFEVRPLDQLRDDAFQKRLAPLLVGGIVAAFLLIMVGLGLVGVLWQNLIRRTREVGLRRAVGASRAGLRGQLLAEQLIIATFGISLAVILALQLPLLGVTRLVPAEALTGGMLVAAAVIYLLTALCTLYPSWMASRIPPAEALRYE